MMAGPIRNVSPGSHTAIAMTKPTAPRPPNAWILYRSDKLKQLPPLKPGERRAQAEVSRMISTLWKHETEGTRQYYERLADEKKAEHSIKYPGYRFQPMKKEEKVALREQRKLEKEAERKARQQRGRHPQPATQPPPQTTNIPLLPFAQHAHIYPPMKPGSIYYPMELFGPAGPSPPVSVASSPTPESTPESTSTSDEKTSSQPPSVAATPATLYTTLPPGAPTPSSVGNPYLAYLGPANNHLMYQPPHMIIPHAIPGFANLALPAATPQIMPIKRAETVHPDLEFGAEHAVPQFNYVPDFDFQSAQYEQFGDDQVTFEFDPQIFESMAALIPQGSDCHNTVAAAHMGHNIFALPDFDLNVLNAHPTGELLVDVPQWEFDLGIYINDGMLDSTTSSNFPLLQNDNADPEVAPTLEEIFDIRFAASGDESPSTLSHPSMPATPAVSQVALSIDLSNTDQKAAASYAPPSGAAHASTRRVGGSWKPPFISNEGPFDHNSPCTSVSHS